MAQKMSKFTWRNLPVLWLALAAMFGLIAWFIVKPGTTWFATEMTYCFSAIIIAEMIYIREKEGKQNPKGKQNPNVFAMLVGSVTACFPIIVSVSSFDATYAAWGSFIGIIAVWMLNAQDSFGGRDENMGLLAVSPMVVWIVWAVDYLYRNIQVGTLAWQSGIFHLGILTFAGYSALRFLSVIKEDEKTEKWGVYLLLFAAIGALLLTQLGSTLRWA